MNVLFKLWLIGAIHPSRPLPCTQKMYRCTQVFQNSHTACEVLPQNQVTCHICLFRDNCLFIQANRISEEITGLKQLEFTYLCSYFQTVAA
jgi:hypothetical protein